MTDFTLNNHLKYSIGGRDWGYREKSIDRFQVSLGAIDTDHYRKSSYAQELRRIADLAYAQLGKDFTVFFSGGTDSEIVVRNFLGIGIKPRCVVIRLENDYNAFDVAEAVSVCDTLGLKLEIVDFNVKEFLSSGKAIEFGKQIQCTQITYLMVYDCILKMGLPAVMGGEVMFTKGLDDTWNYVFRENEDASAMRFSRKFDIPLVYEWFTYTPEILLYYIEHPIISDLLANKMNHKLSSVSSKNQVLRQLYPSVSVKRKSHGFEKLLGFNIEAYKRIASHQIKRLSPDVDGLPMDTVLKMLKG